MSTEDVTSTTTEAIDISSFTITDEPSDIDAAHSHRMHTTRPAMTYEDAMLARQRIDEPTSHQSTLVTDTDMSTQSPTNKPMSAIGDSHDHEHEHITRRVFEMDEHNAFESMRTNRPKVMVREDDAAHHPSLADTVMSEDEDDMADDESESISLDAHDHDEANDHDDNDDTESDHAMGEADRSRIISKDDIESIRGRALNISHVDHSQKVQQPYSGIVYVTAPTTSSFLPRASGAFRNDLSNVDIDDVFSNSEHLEPVTTGTPVLSVARNSGQLNCPPSCVGLAWSGTGILTNEKFVVIFPNKLGTK